jgi:hypothetical protein
MLELLSNHAPLANLILSALMLVVWVVYLQIFLVNHLRSARSVMHIDLGVAWSTHARCLVTNLGSSAIYVQGIVADLSNESETTRAVITDKDEISEESVNEPLLRTNRGTLKAGQTMDIGSLEQITRRTQVRLGGRWEASEIESCTVTVIAVTSHTGNLVGASKRFSAEREGGNLVFSPTSLPTRQLSARQMKKRVHVLMREGSGS